MDGVRPAREYDNPRVEFCDGGERRGPGDAEGEDGEGANSAGDEVGVLRPEVQNQDQVRFHRLGVYGHVSLVSELAVVAMAARV